ncbi:MAG: hypothetical protein ACRCXZ_07955 [Patescibacteria group bacterium]
MINLSLTESQVLEALNCTEEEFLQECAERVVEFDMVIGEIEDVIPAFLSVKQNLDSDLEIDNAINPIESISELTSLQWVMIIYSKFFVESDNNEMICIAELIERVFPNPEEFDINRLISVYTMYPEIFEEALMSITFVVPQELEQEIKEILTERIESSSEEGDLSENLLILDSLIVSK